MHGLLQRQEVMSFVRAAFECSIHLAPREPGLTHAEVLEIGHRAGFQAGEIGDAIAGATAQAYVGDTKLRPAKNLVSSQFFVLEEPDFRNVKAFDSICLHLKATVRSEGKHRATLARRVLVERAIAEGILELDAEAAITIMVMDGHLVEEKAMVKFAQGREQYPIASEQLSQAPNNRPGFQPMPRPERAEAYPIVKDVIERRSDGRPTAAEPLDAFADALDKLGYGRLRLWWMQLVGELRRSEANSCPVMVAVSAAALVEGALTFVTKHARDLGLGVFASKDFDRPSTSWKVDDLVASAATGRESAVLDVPSRLRADELVRVRQRIHAGKMLVEYPDHVPDLRPEEAQAAKETAEMIVRRVLDWLSRYPPAPPTR